MGGLFLRRGDEVIILTGKDKGRRGKIIRVYPQKERVIVEGINIMKKHIKPTQKAPQGGIIEMPAPVHISNCMVVCPRCQKPTRVARVFVSGQKERRCKKCGESLSA